MQTLMEFLVFALGQLAEHQDVIQSASVVGGTMAAAFTVLRFLRAQGQSQYNIVPERTAIAPERISRSLPHPSIGRSASSLDVAVADMKEMFREETRKGLVYGFAQNLLFFVLGTVTSIILQGVS